VAQLADLEGVAVLQRQTRGDGHPVPSLLARHPQVRHAHLFEGVARKLVRRAFDLLQQQDVGRAFVDEPRHLVDSQADGVDVPGGEANCHGPALAGLAP